MPCPSECPRCGGPTQLTIEPATPPLCGTCRARERWLDAEAMQLFNPDVVPAPIPGQLALEDRAESVSTSAFRIHGMVLDGEDAARIVGTAIGVLMETLDSTHSILEGVNAMGWVAACLRDARALGACIEQMVAWTGYDRGTVAELLRSK